MYDFSILIPSYNSNEDDIKKTFSGIKKDANILVIDDGSDIPFLEKADKLIKEYNNLEVIRIESNKGIENALQVGVNHLIGKFKYIARLDIGDFSPWERFLIQCDYLEKNNGIVLLGTWGRFIDKDGGELFISKLPVHDIDIRKKMYINNMFIHPSVMMRADAIFSVGGYRDKYKACEDYDLFFRLVSEGMVENIPEVLIDYEVNFSSISSKKRNIQIVNRIKLIIVNFKFFKYGYYPAYGLMRNLCMLFVSRKLSSRIRTFLHK